jgi:hypothetical protein
MAPQKEGDFLLGVNRRSTTEGEIQSPHLVLWELWEELM